MTVKVTYNSVEKTLWAGHLVERHPFPPQSEGFFSAREISIEPGLTAGRMDFPEQAKFEFKGAISDLERELRNAGGASAVLQIPGLTWWINS